MKALNENNTSLFCRKSDALNRITVKWREKFPGGVAETFELHLHESILPNFLHKKTQGWQPFVRKLYVLK